MSLIQPARTIFYNLYLLSDQTELAYNLKKKNNNNVAATACFRLQRLLFVRPIHMYCI